MCVLTKGVEHYVALTTSMYMQVIKMVVRPQLNWKIPRQGAQISTMFIKNIKLDYN